jgi:hypothetical protein
MSYKKLTGLTHLSNSNGMPLDVDKVIDRYAAKGKHKTEFSSVTGGYTHRAILVVRKIYELATFVIL